MKRKSLFVKFTLLIISAAAAIAIITHAALVFNFIRIRNHPEVLKKFYQTAELFLEDMPVGDTTEVRRYLAKRGFDARCITPAGEWTSSDKVPDTATVKKMSRGRSIFWYRQGLISLFSTDKGFFILLAPNPFGRFIFPIDVFFIWFSLLVLIFGMVHVMIGKWLRPVKAMQIGVKKISGGDFDINLPETTGDELGQLVRSFNRMAQQIRNDIKSRDQLLRDISHELRSPLSRMLLALEFVPEGTTRQTLRNNIITLDKMTGSILEEERLDSPYGKIRRESLELCSLIDEIVAEKNNDTGSINIFADGTVEISADRERLRIALANVIENALKYSTSGSEQVEVRVGRDDDEATIQIIDNGLGIPETELPFIFEPFYRVDKSRNHSKGYGLGMSLTRKIIEAHGGRITIESSPGKGTAVLIRLPV